MKTRKLEMQCQEGKQTTRGKVLPTVALFGALLGAPQDGFAQDISGVNDGALTTEVGSPKMEEKKVDTIDWATAIQGTGVRDDDKGVSEWDDGEKKPGIEPDTDDDKDQGGDQGGDQEGEKEGTRIGVHGFVQVGTSVVPDFAGIFSDKVSGMIGIDAKDSKTGLGLTVIRLDDFHKDPDYPLSKASVVVPYWTISSKDGKRSAGTSVEFSFIDQMPGTVGVTPVVVGSYSKSGRTFEGKYFHDIIKGGKDMDAFRLGITKKVGDILSLTAQGWYKSDYDKKFYGRIIADVDLGGGFGAQLSCIAKDGKFTPTGGVIYKF